MAFIPVKSDWTTKPPFGTRLRTDGHWSVQGLVAAIPYNEAEGQVAINAVDQKNMLHHTLYGTQDMLPGTGGYSVFRGDNILLGWVEWRSVYTALDGDFSEFTTLSFFVKSSDTTKYALWAGSSDDSSVIVAYLGTQNYGIISITGYGNALPPCTSADIDCISLAVNDTTVDVYFNDSKSSYNNTLPISLSSIRFANESRYLGATQAYTSRKLDLAYNKALTPEQIKSLNDNPWQIFEPTITWKELSSTTLTQYGYRFLNDDGNEAGATFAADLNANVSLAHDTITRLRMQIDAAGDPEGRQFQLEYRHKPAGGSFGSWGKVS